MSTVLRAGLSRMLLKSKTASVPEDAFPSVRERSSSSLHSVEPKDSVSNANSGAFPAIAPPDILGLKTLLDSVSEDKHSQVLSLYGDMYGAYCRSLVGFDPRLSFNDDADSNVEGLAAVDALTELGLCYPSISPTSSGGSSRSGSGSSRSRALARGRSYGVKESVRKPVSLYPDGLCYARAFRANARESVAYALGFFPNFEKILSQSAESALPLCATEQLGLVPVKGGYHLVDGLDAVGAVSYNDAVVGLSRRVPSAFGSYGSMLATTKGFPVLNSVASNLLTLEDTLGGQGLDCGLGDVCDERLSEVDFDDGLCYLRMFRPAVRSHLKSMLGVFPTLGRLYSVDASMRVTGSLWKELALVNVGSYFHLRTGLVTDSILLWRVFELLDSNKLTGQYDSWLSMLVGCGSDGFGYLSLFKPWHRASVRGFMGARPNMVDTILNYRDFIDPNDLGGLYFQFVGTSVFVKYECVPGCFVASDVVRSILLDDGVFAVPDSYILS